MATLALILSSAPPRATALIVRDERAHRALATFLGAFLFSVSAVVFYSAGAFGPEDQLILSVMTIGVLLAVVWTIVRWIGHLSGMGQLSNLIERVERIAEQANQNQASLFADDQSEPAPAWTEGGYQILAADCGFIQRVDYDHLTRVATAHHFRLTALVTAGTYVLPGATVVGARSRGRRPGADLVAEVWLPPWGIAELSRTIRDLDSSCYPRLVRALCPRGSTTPAPPSKFWRACSSW